MGAPAFDTYRLVKKLQDGGMSEAAAVALADALQQATAAPDLSGLATKEDLTTALAPLASKVDLAESESRNMRRMGAMIAASTALLGVLISAIAVLQ